MKGGWASARYLVELVGSFLEVIREDLGGAEELLDVAAFSAGPSPHEDCVAADACLDDVRVLETESVKQASSGAMAWAFGSPSFVKTWMQKEPRQCPCVGSTPTRVLRVDQTAGPDWSCERSRRPWRNPMFLLQLNSSAECHL